MRRSIFVVWMAVACGALLAKPAAAAIPDQVNVQGALRDATGALMAGDLSLTIRIYAAQTGGTPLWQETQVVTVAGGLFSTLIPGVPASNPFPADLWTSGTRRWLAIQPAAQAELPRTPLVSVPTALHAGTAGTALSLDCEECVQLTMIDPSVLDAALIFFDDAASGLGEATVQGAIDQLAAAYEALQDSLATVAFTGRFSDLLDVPNGLANGDDDTLATLPCTPGQVAKRTAGGWQCGDDIDTRLTEAQVDTYVANNGYALASSLAQVATTGQFNHLLGIPAGLANGDDDTLATLACAGGQVAKRVNSVWQCGDDIDTKLTEAQVDAYVANNGFALSSSLAAVGLTGQFSDLLGTPAGLGDGDQDTLGGLSCANGQVAKRSGSTWVCGDDAAGGGGGGEGQAFYVVLGLRSNQYCPSGYNVEPFASIQGPNGWLYININKQGLSLSSSNGNGYGQDHLWIQMHNSEGISHVCWKKYTSTSGNPHVSVMQYYGGTACPTGYFYIPTSHTTGNNGWGYSLTHDGGIYIGYVNSWSRDAHGYDDEGGAQSWWWTSHTTTTCVRVYGVDEDPATANGVYPVFMGMNNLSYCPAGWNAWATSSLYRSDGWFYLMGNRTATFIGGMYDWWHTGGMGAHVYYHYTHVYNTCWKYFVRTSTIQPSYQLRTPYSGGCPSGYYPMPMSHMKGWNGYAYMQGTTAWLYLGGLYSWSVWDYEDGYMRQTWTDQGHNWMCLKMFDAQ